MRSEGAFMCGNNVGLGKIQFNQESGITEKKPTWKRPRRLSLGNRVPLTLENNMLTQEIIFVNALNKAAHAGME